MNYHPHNPSYYRSHHYAHQFNLPDSAMLNRKIPVYTSEMPQGVDPFMPSHKKHFQRLGYQSIIGQQHIINHQSPQETNSPAKNKDYYRNLSIEDIEGASTNTLISQALKNRIKAKEHYLRREKERASQDSVRSRNIQASEQTGKQQEAQKIIKKYKNQMNYHQKCRVNTEQSAQTSKQNSKISNPFINQCKNDLQITQQQISQLELRLQLAKSKIDKQQKQLKITPLPIQTKNIPQIYGPTININKPTNQLKLPKIDQNQYRSMKNSPPAEQPQKITRKYEKQQKKRSYTQPTEQSIGNEQTNNGRVYPIKDRIIEKQHENQLSNGEERLMQSRLRRQQIRKLNPTYLSYGSFSGNSRMVYL